MRKYEKYTNTWRRNIVLPGPYRSRRCHFPFAQVFKPSARSRGFSSFALFCDWAGGFDQVMSALSRDVHCFLFCSTTQNQRLLKESIKNWCENTRKYTNMWNVGTSAGQNNRLFHPSSMISDVSRCWLWVACWHQWKIAHATKITSERRHLRQSASRIFLNGQYVTIISVIKRDEKCNILFRV